MLKDPIGYRERIDEAGAWALLLALSNRARAGEPVAAGCGLRLDSAGKLQTVGSEQAWVSIEPITERVSVAVELEPSARQLFEMYLSLCVGPRSFGFVLAHVGQSLDGQIATASGASRNVTGPENIRHMHRLRALCDAVLVGAGTVERDDPQLTTRLVPGSNPARVVLDPMLRLPHERRLFNDQEAPTFVLCAKGLRTNGCHYAAAQIVEVDRQGDTLPPCAIVEALRRLGLRRIFIEGGGVTVSRFLAARALNRLHVTVSPLIIGQGRPGISLPAIDGLENALRPRTQRYTLGEDVMFDCRLD